MMFWLVLNSLVRMAIALIVVYKLVAYGENLNRWERGGLCLAGACGLLTIPSIWKVSASPFEGWGATLFAIGILIYFIGRLIRLHRHDMANREMVRRAQEHLEARK